jgi:hypothetical protein
MRFAKPSLSPVSRAPARPIEADRNLLAFIAYSAETRPQFRIVIANAPTNLRYR